MSQGDDIFIDVADYGAVGDGVTDDAPAIQKAIDAAQALAKGQPVIVMLHRHWIGAPLRLNGRVKLIHRRAR